MKFRAPEPGGRWELWSRVDQKHARWQSAGFAGTFAECLAEMMRRAANQDFNIRRVPCPESRPMPSLTH